MKNNFKLLALAGAMAVSVISCKKDAPVSLQKQAVSKDALAAIASLGFSTDNVIARDGGYLVEGDILLTEANLKDPGNSPNIRIANEEQYRTTNLVTRLPRTITISVTNLPTVYSTAVDEAIRRYNAENLQLKFARASSGTTGNIDVFGFNEGPSGGYITLGSSGFPTSTGDPYNQIKMNTNEQAYGSNPDVNYLASVLTHEIGHAIGFRHTDYMNRQYSCGGRHSNEGSAGVGAIQIPGTPSKADAESWMLACSNGGNRLFNPNDIIALNYLY